MPTWPDAEKTKIPEGHYSFRITREAELKPITGNDGRKNHRVVIRTQACGPNGTFYHTDSFVPWEPRYADLKAALRIEHIRGDVEVLDKVFEADIKYEVDKADASKSYARIQNIVIPPELNQMKLDEETAGGGDDIPF